MLAAASHDDLKGGIRKWLERDGVTTTDQHIKLGKQDVLCDWGIGPQLCANWGQLKLLVQMRKLGNGRL